MNSVHDMGGMHGLGPLEIEQNEPVFHEPWEGRVYGLNTVMSPWGRGRNWAGFRYTLESIPAPDYLRMSYYERWFTMIESRALDSGFLTPEELASGQADPTLPAVQMLPSVQNGSLGSGRLDLDINPALSVDQQVSVKEVNPLGHIRLPRYTRGKLGVIVSNNGIYALQDTDENGQRLGNFPQHVYTVKFTAKELWGENGHDNDRVYVDLWEDYLDAV